ELVAAKQVLDIVLRGRDEEVEVGLLHQPVETLLVEGGLCFLGGSYDCVHCGFPISSRLAASPRLTLVRPVCTKQPHAVQYCCQYRLIDYQSLNFVATGEAGQKRSQIV